MVLIVTKHGKTLKNCIYKSSTLYNSLLDEGVCLNTNVSLLREVLLAAWTTPCESHLSNAFPIFFFFSFASCKLQFFQEVAVSPGLRLLQSLPFKVGSITHGTNLGSKHEILFFNKLRVMCQMFKSCIIWLLIYLIKDAELVTFY